MSQRRLAFVILVLASGQCLSAQAPSTSRGMTVEFRWLNGHDHPGARKYQDPTGETYVLSDSVIVDMRGIERADVSDHVLEGAKVADVIARLNPGGTAAMSESSERHVGQWIAVLVDDAIVNVALVQARVGRIVQVTSNGDHAAAASLAARINAALAAAHGAP